MGAESTASGAKPTEPCAPAQATPTASVQGRSASSSQLQWTSLSAIHWEQLCQRRPSKRCSSAVAATRPGTRVGYFPLKPGSTAQRENTDGFLQEDSFIVNGDADESGLAFVSMNTGEEDT